MPQAPRETALPSSDCVCSASRHRGSIEHGLPRRVLRRPAKFAVLVIASVALTAGPPLAKAQTPTRREKVDPLALAAFLDETRRVENFHQVERVFPVRAVAQSEHPWQLAESPQQLPANYEFEGKTQSVDEFLERTITTGLLVLHDDTICVERYFRGCDGQSRFTSMSVAKSIVSALVGIALAEGHLRDIDQPVGQLVPKLADVPYGATTLRQLLTMSSGIQFREEYDDLESDINRLVAGLGAGQSVHEFVRKLPRARSAGEAFDYLSVDTQVLGWAVEHATGRNLAEYLAEKIWQPMGAESDATWATDNHGQIIAFAMFNATLRDYAKFGALYRDRGNRQGRQLVPSQWVLRSVCPERPAWRLIDLYFPGWDLGYGYQWWVPAGDQGEFTAIGVWGQYVYVHPGRRVVIVKTSVDPNFSDRDPETVACFRAIARQVAD